MTVEEFIAHTQQVIAEDGFDGFLPTLVLETRREVRIAVLEDVPSGVDAESFAKDWASQVVKRNQDYLLAFKADNEHFKVVSRRAGLTAERLVAVEAA